MKESLAKLGFKIFGSKVVRHMLAYVGGFFAAADVVVNTDSTTSLIGGIIAYIIAVASSYFRKTRLSEGEAAAASPLISALASQGVAFLAGWLQQLGYTGSVDDSIGVALFLGNLGLSKLNNPDPKPREPIAGRFASDRPAGLGEP